MNRGMGILSPAAASYLGNSTNWLFEESKGAKWTPEENKRFENALALFDKDTPDRWYNVAAMIPGKTVNDVIKQYTELVEDVSDIEAGLIPVPGYSANSFTLEWIANQGYEGLKHLYDPAGAGRRNSSSAKSSEHERKKGVPWTEGEHRQFLLGLKKYGKGDWRNISRNFVTTRTPTQVASHAQKYFIRQLSGGKDRRRSSIHDITTVNLAQTKSPSPSPEEDDDIKRPSSATDHHQSTAAAPILMQMQHHPSNPNAALPNLDYYNHQQLPNQGSTVAYFNLPDSSTIITAPYQGSTYGQKPHERNTNTMALHGLQFGHYNTIFQMQSAPHK